VSDPARIAETAEWQRLLMLGDRRDELHLRRLFAEDPGRVERMTHQLGDLVIDCSKHLATDEIIDALLALAQRRGVAERAAAMAAGEPVNTTEARPALHTALRAPADAVIEVAGRNVVADVQRSLRRMGEYCERVRSGEHAGATGKPIATVVNIGIGGSDLGPAMAHDTLAAWRHPRLRCKFVSNVDGADLASALAGLDAETTLFVVCSKTFATAETMLNAQSARRWLVDRLGADAVWHHFAAVSANAAAVESFGIGADSTFELWDWVGGRFSVGSAVGLSLMLAIGPEAFAEMLGGFRTVDEHFLSAPPERNAPLLLPLGWHTGPVLFGEPGTKGQHSFHQFLHQGTTVVPADFIVTARPDAAARDLPEAEAHHSQLVANCFAQSAALAFGNCVEPAARPEPIGSTAGSVTTERSASDQETAGVGALAGLGLAGHRELPGNRPSTTILAPSLSPSVLGQLIALYEHQVFVQGAIWGINSFDQPGVELGKTLAVGVAAELSDSDPVDATRVVSGRQASDGHDPSTEALIARFRSLRGTDPA